MKRVAFSMRYPPAHVHPLHERVDEEPALSRAELLTWSPTAEATTLFRLDGDRAAAERATDAIDSLADSRFVAGPEGTYAFLRQTDYEFSRRLVDTVGDARVVFMPPVVFREGGRVDFEAVGEAAALADFHGALSALGELTIAAVHPFGRRRSPAALTERQQEALEAAVSVGYYEVPRTGTVEDVAAALDCAPSTAGELVRKAEATVIRAHLADA